MPRICGAIGEDAGGSGRPLRFPARMFRVAFAAAFGLLTLAQTARCADSPSNPFSAFDEAPSPASSREEALKNLAAREAEAAVLRAQLAEFEGIRADADQAFWRHENRLKAEREALAQGRPAGIRIGPIAAEANKAVGRGDLAQQRIQGIKERAAKLDAQIAAARSQLDKYGGANAPARNDVAATAALGAEAALLRGQIAQLEGIRAEANQRFAQCERTLNAARDPNSQNPGDAGINPGPVAAEANQAAGRGDLAHEQIQKLQKRVAELDAQLAAAAPQAFHVAFAVHAPDVLKSKPENVKYKTLLENLTLPGVRWVRQEDRHILLSVAGDGMKAYSRDMFPPGSRFSAPINVTVTNPKTAQTLTLPGAFLLETTQTVDGPPPPADPKNQPVTLLAQSADGKYSSQLAPQGASAIHFNGGPLIDGWPQAMQLAALNLLKQLAQFFDCFVATAVYQGQPGLPQIATLRRFRDQVLLAHPTGRRFVAWYYQHGPALAAAVRSRPKLIPLLRAALDCLAACLERLSHDPKDPPRADTGGA